MDGAALLRVIRPQGDSGGAYGCALVARRLADGPPAASAHLPRRRRGSENGADPRVKSKEGQTVMDVAADEGMRRLIGSISADIARRRADSVAGSFSPRSPGSGPASPGSAPISRGASPLLQRPASADGGRGAGSPLPRPASAPGSRRKESPLPIRKASPNPAAVASRAASSAEPATSASAGAHDLRRAPSQPETPRTSLSGTRIRSVARPPSPRMPRPPRIGERPPVAQPVEVVYNSWWGGGS